MKDNSLVELSINKVVGNDNQISFWHDRWNRDHTLACLYPNLYSISLDINCTVAEVLSGKSVNLHFRRQIIGVYKDEWIDSQNLLATFTIQPLVLAKILWTWNSSGIFLVHSFYEWTEFGGMINYEYDVIWQSKIPLKIKIFLWLVRKKKVLTKDLLLKKGLQGN